MRTVYLVSYDISQDERRLRVCRALRAIGDHLQYSVFRCELSAREHAEMVTELDVLIDHDRDQVLIVDLGPADGRGCDCWLSLGRPYTTAERSAIVI